MTTMMSDYRDIGGIKAPFVIRQIVPTGQMTIRIEEMRNNLEIEDAKFKP